MDFTDTHIQFFRILERLKKVSWNRQFRTLKGHEFMALNQFYQYHQAHPEVPGMYVSTFAESMCITLPAASKLLKMLESQGWITRMVDKNSRRNTFILLTDEGESIYLAERDHCAQFGARLFERLGEENTERLLSSINQLVDLVEEEFNSIDK